MNRIISPMLGLAAALACATAAFAQPSDGRPPQAGAPDWPAFKAHVDKAKAAAGAEWAAEESYFCLPGQKPNLESDKAIQPVKLFDDVWAIGDEGTVVFVVATPDAVVLIDSGYADKLDNLILPSLTRIGVDPASVKYVLVTHGHADHYGGAKWFQDHGARVAVSTADWDMMAKARPQALAGQPKRDIELKDGQPVVIGGVAFTPVDIPGHTPGSMGFIFPVVDHGKTRMAAIFGSSILRADRLSPATVRIHADGLRRWGQIAAKNKVEVELENHPLYDNMWDKVATLKASPGGPNPFVVGADGYRRFVTVMDECLRATIARKGGDVG